MIIFGIVSEYNPMHNGHIYQIQRIKKLYPQAYIIALCSTSFVQRGEPSFISKHSKSQIALENGIDLFLEMPSIISIQSANFFTFYSIKLLNKLNILSHLSFGVEDLDKEEITNYLDFIDKNKTSIDSLSLKGLSDGLSYKKAYLKALENLSCPISEKIAEANNTLGLLYAKSLRELDSKIEIFPIKRLDKGYHSLEIDESNLQSASAIRKAYNEGIDISPFIPFDIEKAKGINEVILDSFSPIFFQKAFVDEVDPSEIAGFENGILNLIKKNYQGSIDEAIEKSHNKRHSKSRLKRFILNYLLDIKSSDVENLKDINYIRPIAFNEKGRELLGLIRENSDVNIVNKLTKVNNLDEYNKRFLQIDMKAFRLYNLNNPKSIKLDFTINPYKKGVETE